MFSPNNSFRKLTCKTWTANSQLQDSEKDVAFKKNYLSANFKRSGLTVEIRDGVCTSCHVFQHNFDALFQALVYTREKGLHWLYFEFIVGVVLRKNGHEREFGKHRRSSKKRSNDDYFRDASSQPLLSWSKIVLVLCQWYWYSLRELAKTFFYQQTPIRQRAFCHHSYRRSHALRFGYIHYVTCNEWMDPKTSSVWRHRWKSISRVIWELMLFFFSAFMLCWKQIKSIDSRFCSFCNQIASLISKIHKNKRYYQSLSKRSIKKKRIIFFSQHTGGYVKYAVHAYFLAGHWSCKDLDSLGAFGLARPPQPVRRAIYLSFCALHARLLLSYHAH